MDSRLEKLEEFRKLVCRYAAEEGINYTPVKNFGLIRGTSSHGKKPMVYEPVIIFGAQGRKNIYLEGRRYDYCSGDYLTLFLPMPVECEAVDASPENPLLAAGIIFDHVKLSNILNKIDMAENNIEKTSSENYSGIFSSLISEKILDALIRLLNMLSDPVEARVLGDSIIDEIYYRILKEEQGGYLKNVLRQRGQIHKISRAVEYVQQNMDKTVTIDEMADIVNMSSSGFHRKFKEVMHLSPLQYIKSMKLNKARTLITEGKSVSEAGYLVGYNSPAQFSREFKRFFGFLPSAC